ncbi:MAG: phage tail tape measure protein, partial [Eubacterium sp.]|nr:phage tail tape measure protein [Eubacterium sp.]
MSNVGAISGASVAELEELTEKAKEMGATTKFTSAETADAFSYMAMAGWKTEDMLSGIDGILSLAAASGEDLGTTSDIVTDALTAFGLTARDSAHFADVLAAASSNANTNVSMMGETFKYVAPVAGALNISIEDTAEAIGLLANSGIKSSQAGTTLRSILTRLSTDAGASKEALGALGVLTEELGVDFYDSEGKVRNFGIVLSEAREQWKTLGAEDTATFAKKIAGEEGISGWLALMNAAPEDIAKLSGAIENCNGAAEDMSSTMINNLQGDMTILGSAVDGMKISLSEKLNPALREVVQYTTSQIPNVEKVLEKAGGKAISLLDKTVKALPKIVDGGQKLIPVAKGIGTAFAAWKVAQKANEGVSAIKKFNESLKHISDSTSISAAGIAGVSAALVTGAVSFVASVKKAADAKAEEIFMKATEESRNLSEAIYDNRDEMNKLKEAADETAAQDKILMDRTEDLWEELQNLVDKNGNVRKGYEDRVNYIKGELTDTTGIEIELIDGQIQKYSELQEAIEETINKQRAQKLSDTYGDVYAEALLQMKDAPKNFIEASEGIQNSLKAIQSGTSFDYDSVEEWIAFLHRTASMSGDPFSELNVEEIMKDSKTLSGLVDYAYSAMEKNGGSPIVADTVNIAANLENLVNYYKAYNEIKETFSQNQFDAETYEKAEAALANKHYDEAVRLYSEIGDLSKARLADSQKETEERLKLMGDAINEALKEYNASVELGCNDAEKTFQESVKSIVSEAKKGGITSGDILKTGIVDKLSEIDGFDTTALRVFIESESIELGDLTGASIVSGIGNALGTLRESGGAITSAINMALNAALSRAPFPSLHGNNDTFVPMFAKGGFLGSGQGIVAEAG